MSGDRSERGQEAMEERRPQPGERYRHFKNKLYQIITVAVHSETKEELVIYQALYGEFTIYARPLSLFISEVDREKYPDIQQRYCFEKVEQGAKTVYSKEDEVCKTEDFVVNPVKEKSASAFPDRIQVLTGFLDCDSYEEKLEYLRDKKKYMDDRMMDDISFALDIVIEEGELEDRIRTLENCLKTFSRYEGSRLR